MEGSGKKVEKKLTYGQLEAYASQLYAKAVELQKRNRELEESVKRLSDGSFYAEVGLALQCLQQAEHFEPWFVGKVAGRIQDVISPMLSGAKVTAEGESKAEADGGK